MLRRTASDKVLSDKTFNIAKNPKHDGCQRGLPLTIYNFFATKSSNSAATRGRSETLVPRDKSANKSEIMSNQQLAEDIRKTIIRKFDERKGYSCFKSNI